MNFNSLATVLYGLAFETSRATSTKNPYKPLRYTGVLKTEM